MNNIYFKVAEESAEAIESFASLEGIEIQKSFDALDYVVDDIIEDIFESDEDDGLRSLFVDLDDDFRNEFVMTTKDEVQHLIDKEYLAGFIENNLIEIGISNSERRAGSDE